MTLRHLISCLLLAAVPTLLRAADAEKPNIVVIIADDLGYGDISCNGTSAVKTPNIDRLAAGGLRFTSGYCSASTCTPTRYSLLTGAYAFRTKGTGIAPPNGPAIIKPGTETVATLLKKAGYATAAIGKWHLGLGVGQPDWNGELKPGPLEIGFDHCLLLPTTNDRVPQVFVDDHRVRNLDPADPLWVGDKPPSPDHPTGVTHRNTLTMDWSVGHNGTIHNGIGRIGYYTGGMKARFRDQDLADAWVNEANNWIGAHKDGPFFLYYASHDIHVPRAPHERFVGKSGLGPRGDAIVEFDWQVGELMKTLERHGLAEKTLVVLCSDNGPVLDDGYKDQAVELLGSHKPSGVYRGGKYSVFEGGTRVPFITRWKGRIQPGVSDRIVCTVDFAASFAALAGGKIAGAQACLDSLDLHGVLLGEADAKGREYLLQQDNGGQGLGLREGGWKLVRHGGRRKAGGYQLYDLTKDPGETTDVADLHPDVLTRLQARIDQIISAGRTRPAE
ncbi:MAG: arylsulfatase [Kiritimatiellia bacterium]